MHTDVTLCLPADDEVRRGDQEGPKRHQQTPDCYDLGSVEFGAEIAHKGDHQQIPCSQMRALMCSSYSPDYLMSMCCFFGVFLTVLNKDPQI